ncbi:carboxylesterase/lipase family protein [Candidatus Sumerlaeota bacterium]|nr:carboxylesterase/lipase family protein [Candidatus Sumerlaeota bacterium]
MTASADKVVVETNSGKVRGTIRNGIFTYKGIPYGASPAGSARFQPPAPPRPWSSIRDSMQYGPVCPQEPRAGWAIDRLAWLFDWDDGHSAEDCLRLNVWTPGIKDNAKRPVMVWLHGGGFQAGSSQELPSYHGERLARRGDVVVVSVNHRLGVLAHLDLASIGGEKYKHSANAGTLDLVLALQWVRDNIANFGGDPGNVTIFGQSGGGGKVTALMAMPSAAGLFTRRLCKADQYFAWPLRSVGRNSRRRFWRSLASRRDRSSSFTPCPSRSLSRRALRETAKSRSRSPGRLISARSPTGWVGRRSWMGMSFRIIHSIPPRRRFHRKFPC